MSAGPTTTLVMASANAHKVREIAEIVGDRLTILPRPDDVPDVVEDAPDLVGNARLKAVAICAATGRAAVADDTGLEVDALDGAPGVYSARFAGTHGDDAANRAQLLARMAAVPDPQRGAAFQCALVLADLWGPLGPGGLIVAMGRCAGRITHSPRGDGGFGYDALFEPDGETRTMAELSDAEKHARSHRGEAVTRMLPVLRGYLAARGKNAWRCEGGAV